MLDMDKETWDKISGGVDYGDATVEFTLEPDHPAPDAKVLIQNSRVFITALDGSWGFETDVLMDMLNPKILDGLAGDGAIVKLGWKVIKDDMTYHLFDILKEGGQIVARSYSLGVTLDEKMLRYFLGSKYTAFAKVGSRRLLHFNIDMEADPCNAMVITIRNIVLACDKNATLVYNETDGLRIDDALWAMQLSENSGMENILFNINKCKITIGGFKRETK